MNVQIEINGLGHVDFVSAYGWIRNPKVELCGVDDADLCKLNVAKFMNSIEAVPFENLSVCEQYVDGARKQMMETAARYAETGREVLSSGVVFIHIRPVPKSSQDA